jgi:hypothetical protein
MKRIRIFNGVFGSVNSVLGFYHLSLVRPPPGLGFLSWDGIMGLVCFLVGIVGVCSFVEGITDEEYTEENIAC